MLGKKGYSNCTQNQVDVCVCVLNWNTKSLFYPCKLQFMSPLFSFFFSFLVNLSLLGFTAKIFIYIYIYIYIGEETNKIMVISHVGPTWTNLFLQSYRVYALVTFNPTNDFTHSHHKMKKSKKK